MTRPTFIENQFRDTVDHALTALRADAHEVVADVHQKLRESVREVNSSLSRLVWMLGGMALGVGGVLITLWRATL